MNRIICNILLGVLILLTGCFKDYEDRYLFNDETQVEFEDAVVKAAAAGKDYPMLTPLDNESGTQQFRVNLIGPQSDTSTVIHFMVLPDESSAVAGKDYTLPQGDTIQIAPHSSFGWVKVKVNPAGSGSPTLALKLLGNKNIKGAERYCRIGFRIMFPLTPPDPHAIDTLNDIIFYKNILLGSYSNDNIGGYFDLKTGNAYTIAGADDHQDAIDMILLRSSVSEMNLMTPASSALTGWGDTKHIPDEWGVRNDGVFIKLPNPSVEEEELFLNSSSVTDLLVAYNQILSAVGSRPGYNATNDGPANRIRNIGTGDMILYYSETRKQVALMKVGEVVPGPAGSIQLQVKTGMFDPNVVLLSSTVTLGGYATSGTYGGQYQLDLATHTVYNVADADNEQAHIDLLNLFSGTSNVNFMTPSNSAVTGWGSSKRIQDWDTRNTGIFVKLGKPIAAELDSFAHLVTQNQLVQAFDQASTDVVDRPDYDATYDGPGSRIRDIQQGDIIYFKSTMNGRDLYAAMQVIKITLGISNGRENIELLIKSSRL